MAVAAPAAAAPGDLAYRGCISSGDGRGCASLAPDSAPVLYYPAQIVTAPGGADAYAVQPAHGGAPIDALTHLRRGADGQLTFSDCVTGWGGSSCAMLAGEAASALSGPERLAVSPDGGDIYVAAPDGYALVRFKRGAGGVPVYAGCMGAVANGCTDPPGADLSRWRPVDVAVSADSRWVYAVGEGDPGIVAFRRAADGSLSLDSCSGPGPACEQPPAFCGDSGCRWSRAMNYPKAVAVSDDGRSVYVATHYNADRFAGNAIARFSKDGNGLHYADCVGVAEGCRPLAPGASITGVRSIAVASGSRDVYVSGRSDGDPPEAAVTHFRAGDDGSLTWADCVGTGANNCTRVPDGMGVNPQLGVAVAPDGTELFAGHLTAFKLDANGSMTPATCFGEAWTCLDAPVYGHDRQSITASADGLNVYAASEEAISTFARGSLNAPPTSPAPAVSLEQPSNVSWHEAGLSGSVDSHGKVAHYQWQLGRTTAYELTAGAHIITSDRPTSVYEGRTGLQPGTTYHYRLRARYGNATVTSADATFTTPTFSWKPDLPAISDVVQYAVGPTYASFDATVTSTGAAATARFEYGLTDSYGSSVTAKVDPLLNYNGAGRASADVTGLQPGRTYHFRAVATSSSGTSRSPDYTFTTAPATPIPTAPALGPPTSADVATDAATLRAPLNPRASATRWWFEYGPNGTRTPVGTLDGDGAEHLVSAHITGLAPSTEYAYRLVADAAGGQVVGRQGTFTTSDASAPQPPAQQPPPATTGDPADTPSGPGSSTASTPPESGSPITSPLGPVDPLGGTEGTPSPAVPPPRLRLTLKGAPQTRSDVLRLGARVSLRCSRACRVRLTVLPSLGRGWASRTRSLRLGTRTKRLRVGLPLAARLLVRKGEASSLRVTAVAATVDGATASRTARVRLR